MIIILHDTIMFCLLSPITIKCGFDSRLQLELHQADADVNRRRQSFAAAKFFAGNGPIPLPRLARPAQGPPVATPDAFRRPGSRAARPENADFRRPRLRPDVGAGLEPDPCQVQQSPSPQEQGQRAAKHQLCLQLFTSRYSIRVRRKSNNYNKSELITLGS